MATDANDDDADGDDDEDDDCDSDNADVGRDGKDEYNGSDECGDDTIVTIIIVMLTAMQRMPVHIAMTTLMTMVKTMTITLRTTL